MDNSVSNSLKRPALPRPLWAVWALSLLLAFGCASHADRTLEARNALDAGRPKLALSLLNEELGVDSAAQQPDDLSGDQALLLLDRAMVLQQLRQFQLSAQDLQAADKRIDLLDLSRSSADDIGKYIFSDDSGPYRAPAYEKLLINTMNMVNYLARRELNGALIEARRFSVIQRYLKDYETKGAKLSGPGSYLAGFAHEKSNRPTDALRYYDEALQYGNYRSLYPAIARLAEQSSYRSPRIRRVLKQLGVPQAPGRHLNPHAPAEVAPSSRAEAAAPDEQPEAELSNDAQVDAQPQIATSPKAVKTEPAGLAGPEKPAEILFVISYGRAPAKYAQRLPIGLALTRAATFMAASDHSAASNLAAQGLVTWVNFPSLEEPRGQYQIPIATLNSLPVALEPVIGIDLEASASWQEHEGSIIASAITRMVARYAAGEIAGAAAGSDDLLGLLISLFTQATLSALDTPDTRSWSTLPARMAFGRAQVPPGTHQVRLASSGQLLRQTLQLGPGDWALVNLTVLR